MVPAAGPRAEPAVPAALVTDDSAADLAADSSVSIFSVSFNETYNEEQSAYLESLTRGYGTFYETPDASELPSILAEIAASIPISIVQ